MEPQLSTKPKPSPSRIWLLRLALMLGVPALLLGLAEGAFRLAGYGHPTSFFVASPHHENGALIENAKFAWRFLPPTLARASQPTLLRREKASATTRVFMFGESAAEGDPEPAFGMPRLLEVLLEGRFPGRDFEVINAAVTAINSHAILPIARECAGLDGDFWVLYIGHNEVMGPFGAGTVFGRKTPPLSTLRLGLSLKQFRLGQWVASFSDSTENADGMQWKGMGMFLDQQLRADDPQLKWVYDSHNKNLSDILAESRQAGVHVVMSTVASNLRDSAPFAATDAVEQFQLARSLEAEGKTGEAHSHYVRARDLDALRFRADSKLNAITQALGQAGSGNVTFIDAQAALDAQSPSGTAGRETFYEHVHFTFEGNHRLAKLFAEGIALRLASGGDKPSGPWLTSGECAGRLAYTDWDRGVVLASVIRRLQQPPFSHRLNNDEALGQLRDEAQRVARRLDRTAALATYDNALKARPNDWRLLQRRGLLLSSAGRHDEGVDSLKRAIGPGRAPASRIVSAKKRWPPATQLGRLATSQRRHNSTTRLPRRIFKSGRAGSSRAVSPRRQRASIGRWRSSRTCRRRASTSSPACLNWSDTAMRWSISSRWPPKTRGTSRCNATSSLPAQNSARPRNHNGDFRPPQKFIRCFALSRWPSRRKSKLLNCGELNGVQNALGQAPSPSGRG